MLLAVGPASVLAAPASVELAVLAPELPEPSPQAVTSGSLDGHFQPFNLREARNSGKPFWLRAQLAAQPESEGTAALTVRSGRHLHPTVYVAHGGGAVALPAAAALSGYRGVHDLVYALPDPQGPELPVYLRVTTSGSGAEELMLLVAPLRETMARGEEETRLIAGTFGALVAMSLAALLIWFVLPDRLFLLYAGLFSLQSLYIAYLSGQAFDWPLFSAAMPLGSHAWNVPAALGGAVSCLFVREIADLRHYSPRVYRIFGTLAWAFLALAVANGAKELGVGGWVTPLGNLLFVGTAAFTLVVSFLAWRRGNRAAGWFLLAWGLLEAFTIATAASLLIRDTEPRLLYFGLPLSMVAAAILVALGTADRLREQRRALTDAERRAQTDSLTGVLNRRSFLERLEAACLRAKARELPISLLFIDLDHFKMINDSFGHRAGDACLVAVIEPMQAELRQSDVIGRYGGEEFVVILSSADVNAARAIAERILRRVAELRVEGFGSPIQLTCSIGVAASDLLGVWGEQLISSADAAVYAAKHSGRNQVQIAVPAMPSVVQAT